MGSIGAVLSRLRLLPMVDFGRERVFKVSLSDARYRRLVKGPDFMAIRRGSKTLITHTTICGKASMG